MSDLAHAALISGGIFVIVMLTQLGRRELDVRKLLRPVLLAGVLGFSYLKDMPFTSAGDLDLYAVGLALGLVFAAGATLVTRMELDAVSGKVATICGAGFIVIWAVAVGARLAFIYSVDNIAWVHDHVGQLMMQHRIDAEAIAPFFVIWAITMVIARVVAVQVRAQALRTAVRV